MGVADTNAVLRELKTRLAELYGAKLASVILFGSHARGDATEDSDIDALIVLRSPFDPRTERKRTLPIIAGLSLEHDVLIADIIAAEDDYWRASAPLYRVVQREGLRL